MASKIVNELNFRCDKCKCVPKHLWIVGEIKPVYLCPKCARGE